MNRILIHTPINIRKALVDALKQHLKEFRNKHGMEISVETPGHNHAENWLVKCMEEGSFPDMVIAHATDFAPLNRQQLKEIFLPVGERFPLRRELDRFREEGGLLNPVFLVPLVIACNTDMVDEAKRPEKWEDLLKSEWENMVTFPAGETPISQAVLSFLADKYPDKFRDFFPSIVFQSSVPEVLQSMGAGNFPLAVANISFAKMLRQKHVIPLWPREGAVCIPQVAVWSRNADKRLLELGEFFRSRQLQELFAHQGFIPVIPEVSLPAELPGRNFSFTWEGWDPFLESIRKGCGAR